MESGQSNMVFPLKLAYTPEKEAASLREHAYRNFRFFMTARGPNPNNTLLTLNLTPASSMGAISSTPQWNLTPKPTACDTVTKKCDQWLTVDEALQVDNATKSAFIMDFSAVCYMSVRDIIRIQSSQSRPMALIQSAWGGTRVEAWMSKEATTILFV